MKYLRIALYDTMPDIGGRICLLALHDRRWSSWHGFALLDFGNGEQT